MCCLSHLCCSLFFFRFSFHFHVFLRLVSLKMFFFCSFISCSHHWLHSHFVCWLHSHFVCLFVDPKKRPSLSAISQRLSVLIEKYTQSENVRAHLQEALEKRETQALVASAAIKSAEGEDGED
jgi:hypothetical protein